MSQPKWEFVANLGDASPLEYGGLFLYHDTTGVYGYELEKLEEPYDDFDDDALDNCGVDDDGSVELDTEDEKAKRSKARWTIHRICLDKCQEYRHAQLELGETDTVYLVPASYDPETYPHPVSAYVEWFAKDLSSVASCMGTTREELVDALCSDDGKERAWAYQCIYDYHGWENGDSYPLTLTRKEVKARYTDGEL